MSYNYANMGKPLSNQELRSYANSMGGGGSSSLNKELRARDEVNSIWGELHVQSADKMAEASKPYHACREEIAALRVPALDKAEMMYEVAKAWGKSVEDTAQICFSGLTAAYEKAKAAGVMMQDDLPQQIQATRDHHLHTVDLTLHACLASLQKEIDAAKGQKQLQTRPAEQRLAEPQACPSRRIALAKARGTLESEKAAILAAKSKSQPDGQLLALRQAAEDAKAAQRRLAVLAAGLTNQGVGNLEGLIGSSKKAELSTARQFGKAAKEIELQQLGDWWRSTVGDAV